MIWALGRPSLRKGVHRSATVTSKLTLPTLHLLLNVGQLSSVRVSAGSGPTPLDVKQLQQHPFPPASPLKGHGKNCRHEPLSGFI